MSRARSQTALTVLGLMLWGGLVAGVVRRTAMQEVAWPDECIYLVGARNLLERGTLNTNFYLTHSILIRGHPHRDVHMPGYVLALAPFVAALGPGLAAAAVLNVVLFLACILLVYALARGLLESQAQAVTAAALATVLPPLPGYLFVAYPEIVVCFVFLSGLAWLVNGSGSRHAVVAGILYGLGALFRETLLVALPLYLVRLCRREAVRAFLPAAVATLALLVPFARDRAIHPNALYPSLVEEARRSAAPVSTLASALRRNLERNLALVGQVDPFQNAEDAVLIFLGLLAATAALGLRSLPPSARRFALASLACLAALTAALLLLYVVRERGGVWGGVRAYMAWAPVLLVLATPLLFRPRRRLLTAGLALAVGLGFGALDCRHILFFNRYKGTDLEDQDRQARYIAAHIDRHRPQRIVSSRSFTYGLTHYPVEVVWSLPGDHKELQALEKALPYDFLIIHERSPLRLALIDNPRYLRINKEDKGAELLIWRRLF